MRHQRGFTLVEMLVAMTVFSLVALITAGIASAALEMRSDMDVKDAELRQLQMARGLIKADLAQLVWRPTRDAFGAPGRAGFTGGPMSEHDPLVGFVRGGWINPDSADSRSSLQYVEYVFQDNTLIRRTRPYLDPTVDTPVIAMPLLRHVRAASVSFLLGDKWQPQWRIGPGVAALPDAVAIEMTIDGLGSVRQLFAVPAP